jgi:hypothetical protein
MHPAGEGDTLADLRGAQLTAGMATEGGARHGAAMVADHLGLSWPAA